MKLKTIKTKFNKLTKEEILTFIYSQFDNVPEQHQQPVLRQMNDFYKQVMR